MAQRVLHRMAALMDAALSKFYLSATHASLVAELYCEFVVCTDLTRQNLSQGSWDLILYNAAI